MGECVDDNQHRRQRLALASPSGIGMRRVASGNKKRTPQPFRPHSKERPISPKGHGNRKLATNTSLPASRRSGQSCSSKSTKNNGRRNSSNTNAIVAVAKPPPRSRGRSSKSKGNQPPPPPATGRLRSFPQSPTNGNVVGNTSSDGPATELSSIWPPPPPPRRPKPRGNSLVSLLPPPDGDRNSIANTSIVVRASDAPSPSWEDEKPTLPVARGDRRKDACATTRRRSSTGTGGGCVVRNPTNRNHGRANLSHSRRSSPSILAGLCQTAIKPDVTPSISSIDPDNTQTKKPPRRRSRSRSKRSPAISTPREDSSACVPNAANENHGIANLPDHSSPSIAVGLCQKFSTLAANTPVATPSAPSTIHSDNAPIQKSRRRKSSSGSRKSSATSTPKEISSPMANTTIANTPTSRRKTRSRSIGPLTPSPGVGNRGGTKKTSMSFHGHPSAVRSFKEVKSEPAAGTPSNDATPTKLSPPNSRNMSHSASHLSHNTGNSNSNGAPIANAAPPLSLRLPSLNAAESKKVSPRGDAGPFNYLPPAITHSLSAPRSRRRSRSSVELPHKEVVLTSQVDDLFHEVCDYLDVLDANFDKMDVKTPVTLEDRRSSDGDDRLRSNDRSKISWQSSNGLTTAHKSDEGVLSRSENDKLCAFESDMPGSIDRASVVARDRCSHKTTTTRRDRRAAFERMDISSSEHSTVSRGRNSSSLLSNNDKLKRPIPPPPPDSVSAPKYAPMLSLSSSSKMLAMADSHRPQHSAARRGRSRGRSQSATNRRCHRNRGNSELHSSLSNLSCKMKESLSFGRLIKREASSERVGGHSETSKSSTSFDRSIPSESSNEDRCGARGSTIACAVRSFKHSTSFRGANNKTNKKGKGRGRGRSSSLSRNARRALSIDANDPSTPPPPTTRSRHSNENKALTQEDDKYSKASMVYDVPFDPTTGRCNYHPDVCMAVRMTDEKEVGQSLSSTAHDVVGGWKIVRMTCPKCMYNY